MDNTCATCGRVNAADAAFCSGCGRPLGTTTGGEASPAGPQPGAPPIYIPNNLALAIVATILCWPLGVAAIVYASQVDSLARYGQYEAARRNSDLARKWSFWAIGLMLAGLAIYILIFGGMFLVMGVMAAFNH